MINFDCQNYDGDEDCNKCCKHGYIYSCGGCEDYVDFFGHKRKVKEDDYGEYY